MNLTVWLLLSIWPLVQNIHPKNNPKIEKSKAKQILLYGSNLLASMRWISCHRVFIRASRIALGTNSWVLLQVMTDTMQLYTYQNHLFTDGNDFSVWGLSEEHFQALWSSVGCWFREGEKQWQQVNTKKPRRRLDPIRSPHWRLVWRRSQDTSQPPAPATSIYYIWAHFNWSQKKSVMWRAEWNYSQNCTFVTASEEMSMFEWLQEEGWLLAWFISSRLGIPGHVYWPNTEWCKVFLTLWIWEGIIHTAHFKSSFHSVFLVGNQCKTNPSEWRFLHELQSSVPMRKSELSFWKWKIQSGCAGKISNCCAGCYPMSGGPVWSQELDSMVLLSPSWGYSS